MKKGESGEGRRSEAGQVGIHCRAYVPGKRSEVSFSFQGMIQGYLHVSWVRSVRI